MLLTRLSRVLLVLLCAQLLGACTFYDFGPTHPTATPLAGAGRPAAPQVMPTRSRIVPGFPTQVQATIAAPVAQTKAIPLQTLLPEGWSRFFPGGDTECARGGTYSFWARPGTSGRLVIFFEGGGGCWDAASCAKGSSFFDDYVGDKDSPERQAGVFETDNPDNSFAGDSMVFVPYCTGDVYMGNHVQTYTADGVEPVTIRHKGFVNATSALHWSYNHFPHPTSVFVAGCSAGSVGSAFLAPYIMEHYANVRVAQLGDAEAFVFDHELELQNDWRAHDNFAPWIPALSNIRPGQFTMARFYSAVAAYYPRNTFAQYSSEGDAVQQRYYFANKRSDSPPPWGSVLLSSLDEIQTHAPNFVSYVGEGNGHCVTPTSRFYTDATRGVPIRDWVEALADGRTVTNVRP